MFCEECGAKNKKNAIFCEECGHNLQGKVKEEKKNTKQELVVETVSKKPKNKIVDKTDNVTEVKPVDSSPKNKSNIKLLLIIIISIVVVIICLLIYGFISTSPESVTKNILNAYSYNDYEMIYDYVDVANEEFTGKEKFLEELPEKYDEPEFEYKILETEIDGNSAIVEYRIDDDIYEIELKRDGNKLLIFPNWTLEIDGIVEEDFEIYAIKNSKIKIDGIDIDKYYDDKLSDEYTDVYVIDYMLSSAVYEIEVEYPFGFMVEEDFTPYGDLDLTYFDEDDIDTETEEKIVDVSVSYINEIYENIKQYNSWSDIEDNYKLDFEDDYEAIFDNITNYYVLDDVTVIDAKLEYLSFDDGLLEVTLDGSLLYEASFDFDSSDKFSGERTDLYFAIYLKYDDGDYDLAGIDYLPSYFPSN